jgi:hypothetical protein
MQQGTDKKMLQSITQDRLWETWYEFKDELESNVGFYIPVFVWLEIRPRKPLPWDYLDMKAIIARISDTRPTTH